jgi:hypothetical protein
VQAGEAPDAPDQVPPPPCGKISGVQDDFTNPPGQKWVLASEGLGVSGPPEVVDGRLRMSFGPEGGDPDSVSELRTRSAYDAFGNSVSVRAHVVDGLGDSALELRAVPGREYGVKVGIRHAGGQLEAYRWRPGDGGYEVDWVMSAPYDPSLHRFWRLREEAGEVIYEVAGEDGGFRPFATATPSFWPGHAVAALVMKHSPLQVGSGFVEFDDFNVGQPAAALCPIADLQDDFREPTLSGLWFRDGSGCTAELIDGTLRLAAPLGGSCRVISTHAYDLTAGRLRIAIGDEPDGNGTLRATLLRADYTYVELLQRSGQLSVSLVVDGEVLGGVDVPNAAVAGQI